jgi:hypothetical protein
MTTFRNVTLAKNNTAQYNEAVHQLFVDLNKARDSVRKDVLYNNLIEFGSPVKLAGLKMCLNGTYNGVGYANTCLTHFLLRMVKKRRSFITIAFQLHFNICH